MDTMVHQTQKKKEHPNTGTSSTYSCAPRFFQLGDHFDVFFLNKNGSEAQGKGTRANHLPSKRKGRSLKKNARQGANR